MPMGGFLTLCNAVSQPALSVKIKEMEKIVGYFQCFFLDVGIVSNFRQFTITDNKYV